MAYGIVASNDPVNKIDPSGEEGELIGSMNAMAMMGDIAKIAVLSAAATCATIYAAGSVSGSAGAFFSAGPGGMCVPNQMRVQLQESDRSGTTLNTLGVPLMAPSALGVTTLEVRNAMYLDIFYGHPAWFPNSLESDLHGAIMYLSIRIGRYPAIGGTSQSGTIENAVIPSRRTNFRIDIENLRGRNLRL